MTSQASTRSIAPLRSQLLLYLVAALAIVLDQYTKTLVRTGMVVGETIIVHPSLRNVFDLTYTTNTGAAFGMFKSGGPVFIVLAAVVVAVIIYYNRELPAQQRWLRVALGLQMGGAIGNNLIDRPLRGSVVDFLHVHYWPVFNVADSCISIGVVIMGLLMIHEARTETKTNNFEVEG
jgi:signal peptidase II